MKGTAETWRVSSLCHEEFMGERCIAQTPLGSRGGGARVRRTSPSPSRHLKGGVLPILHKARVILVLNSLTVLHSPFFFFFDSSLPLASVLSPPCSPHPTFTLPSPRPPPPFFTARVECHLFIYLSPRHQHPFRAPKLFNVSGRRKGQEVLTRRG